MNHHRAAQLRRVLKECQRIERTYGDALPAEFARRMQSLARDIRELAPTLTGVQPRNDTGAASSSPVEGRNGASEA
ncbi:MAG TPA: hypothetical protein VGR62_16850 [Candidatus Binatia bacterium]|jgi:hypothetical protein|nr:hypothetical protein [Candidatus Binatia bacterium]